jgi:hypothetical protein
MAVLPDPSFLRAPIVSRKDAFRHTALATARPRRYRYGVFREQPRSSAVGALWRSERRIARAVWRLSALGIGAAGAGLVLLHVWIFWEQLWSGQLAHADSAVRWLAAAGLTAALAVLRRQGVSLRWGRPAFTTWLLVGLLHAWSAGAAPAAALPGALPAEPAAGFLLPLTTALAAGLFVLLARRRYDRRPDPSASLSALDRRDTPVTPQWALAVSIPRAPPARVA